MERQSDISRSKITKTDDRLSVDIIRRLSIDKIHIPLQLIIVFIYIYRHQLNVLIS